MEADHGCGRRSGFTLESGHFGEGVACCRLMADGPLTPTTRKVFAAGDAVDRYTLMERLGSGSMGEVWKAQHNGLSASCAVKLLRPELARSSEIAARFVTEGMVCGRLRHHPNVVHVYDAGIDKSTNTAFLAMELLQGETLGRWPDDGVPMPLDKLRAILPQLRSAVEAAHQLDIVHRDLKPENLFLTTDAEGRVLLKVLDFGIARVLTDGGARTATQAGTPVYAAPEQLGQIYREEAERGGIVIADHISATTDVWALGLIAFELLTGCAVDDFWGAHSLEDLRRKISLEPIPRPSERARTAADKLPQGFDHWFSRCLERDASLRWPSFGEAITQLIGLIDQQMKPVDDATRSSVSGDPRPASLTPPPVGLTPTPSRQVADASEAAPPHSTNLAPTLRDITRQRERLSPRRFAGLGAYLLLVGVLMAVALVVAFIPRSGNIIVTVFGTEKRPLANTVQVFLDGQKRCGTSPCILSGLSVGNAYAVRVAAPGYSDSVIRGIRVERSKVVPVHVALTRAPNAGSMKVSAEGSDLKLWVDGTELGPLPQEVDPLLPGEHVVRVGGNARFETYEEKVVLAENEHRVVGPLKLKVLVGMLVLEPGPNSDGATLQLVAGGERTLISGLPHRTELDLTKENRLVVTKHGFATLDVPLEFPAGQAERQFVVTLSPIHASEAAPNATAGLGTLTIVSHPAATVFMDGRDLGRISRKRLLVAPGFYVVAFHHPQFKTRKLAITVDSGKTAVASVTFP